MSHSRETDFRVRRRDVVGHRSAVSEEEVTIHQGIRLTSAVRTWCDLAAFCGVDDLVVAGDHFVRIPNRRYEGRAAPYCSLVQLRAAVEGRRGFRGRPRAVAALTMIRVGADSLPETKLRLKLVGSGLPEPVLQVPPTPGAPRGYRADMGYPQWKIAIQYDGGVHFNPQRAREDQRRDNAFLAQGWLVLRFNREDFRDGFREAVEHIGAAIRLRAQD